MRFRVSSLFFFPFLSPSLHRYVNVSGRECAPVWPRMFWEIRFAKENSPTGASDFGSKFGNALFPLKKVFERGLRGSIYRLDSSPLLVPFYLSLARSPALSLSLSAPGMMFLLDIGVNKYTLRDEYSLITRNTRSSEVFTATRITFRIAEVKFFLSLYLKKKGEGGSNAGSIKSTDGKIDRR